MDEVVSLCSQNTLVLCPESNNLLTAVLRPSQTPDTSEHGVQGKLSVKREVICS